MNFIIVALFSSIFLNNKITFDWIIIIPRSECMYVGLKESTIMIA